MTIWQVAPNPYSSSMQIRTIRTTNKQKDRFQYFFSTKFCPARPIPSKIEQSWDETETFHSNISCIIKHRKCIKGQKIMKDLPRSRKLSESILAITNLGARAKVVALAKIRVDKSWRATPTPAQSSTPSVSSSPSPAPSASNSLSHPCVTIFCFPILTPTGYTPDPTQVWSLHDSGNGAMCQVDSMLAFGGPRPPPNLNTLIWY